MNETMLALLGFATIITVIVLLLKNVTVPSLAFISVATASSAVLVLTGTFSVQEMGDFIAEGVKGVHATAALFIFSVLFFGIMTDVGMFDKIIGALMKKVGHNVVGVTLMTSIIAMIAHLDGAGDVDNVEIEAAGNTETREYARPKLFWFNLILTLAVIACLIVVKVPSYYVFMLGCAIALLVNFRGASLQNKIIKSHAGPAIMMSSTILCAGVFLGVMEKTGIMNNMATVLAGFVPMSMGRFLPLIIGVLAVPLTLMFDTDSFFFGLMPVLIEIAGNFGVLPAHIAIVMVVCRNCATFISPVVPATFLGIGLADVEIKDHIKNCFFWIWGVSIVCLLAGLLLGVIKI
ncbi:SLC13 family permease [Blautia sp. MSJ-9]|uniref:SLC13 family permease n=1 Tax=Blautia sp. MSJ-9 TaxID=2841511 RepID=UPI001C11B1CA|nr:SLC13 family permease [Blautia sp. MSJ-9]MBU5681688.1 citrate transporter [Blautia sp. MSJ-9]